MEQSITQNITQQIQQERPEQLTQSEKIRLGSKEITKRIREQLKKEFKDNSVFSVTREVYSMGRSIHISLMSSKIKIIKDYSEIPEIALIRYADNDGRTREQIKEIQETKYHQLNNYGLRDNYDPLNWNNGVFLTEAGHNLLKRVVEIVNYYNYDNSDPMTDYFDVNFYFDLAIGKWDKPFIQEEIITTQELNDLAGLFNKRTKQTEEKSLFKAIQEGDKQTEQELTKKAENGETIRII